jgi:hypothetical protein
VRGAAEAAPANRSADDKVRGRLLAVVIALGTGACDELFGLDELRSPDAAIQPGDLMLAYAFDDPAGSTTATDDSGNANTALLLGPVLAPGRYATGLSFDGVDDHVVAPNSPSIDIADSGLTIAFWARVDHVESDMVILGKLWAPLGSFGEPFYQYGLEYDSATRSIMLLLPETSGLAHRSFVLGGITGALQHIAFSYDGTTVRGYIEGMELFTATWTGQLVARDTQLVIGADGNRQQPLRGHLDNVRIYRRALTANEIVTDRDTARTRP